MLTILRSCFPVLSGSFGSTIPERSGNEAQPPMATHVTCLCTFDVASYSANMSRHITNPNQGHTYFMTKTSYVIKQVQQELAACKPAWCKKDLYIKMSDTRLASRQTFIPCEVLELYRLALTFTSLNTIVSSVSYCMHLLYDGTLAQLETSESKSGQRIGRSFDIVQPCSTFPGHSKIRRCFSFKVS